MRKFKDSIVLALLLVSLAGLTLPVAAGTVIFEFTGNCTPFGDADCTAFGLLHGDPLSGGFQLDASLGGPGAVSMLEKDQYLFVFTFGNQRFNQDDAITKFGFNVSLDGAAISSISGVFRNAAGATLTLLLPSTVKVVLGEFEADSFTFGSDAIGKGWQLSSNSDLFLEPVPLPAGLGMMASALLSVGALRVLQKSRRSSCTGLSNRP